MATTPKVNLNPSTPLYSSLLLFTLITIGYNHFLVETSRERTQTVSTILSCLGTSRSIQDLPTSPSPTQIAPIGPTRQRQDRPRFRRGHWGNEMRGYGAKNRSGGFLRRGSGARRWCASYKTRYSGPSISIYCTLFLIQYTMC